MTLGSHQGLTQQVHPGPASQGELTVGGACGEGSSTAKMAVGLNGPVLGLEKEHRVGGGRIAQAHTGRHLCPTTRQHGTGHRVKDRRDGGL